MRFPYKALKSSMGLFDENFCFRHCLHSVMIVRTLLHSRVKHFLSPLLLVVSGWTVPRPDQGRDELTIPPHCLLFMSGSCFL